MSPLGPRIGGVSSYIPVQQVGACASRNTLLLVFGIALLCSTVHAQVTLEKQQYPAEPNIYSIIKQIDLNGDGAPDFITQADSLQFPFPFNTFSVILTNADGSYKAPVHYSTGGTQPGMGGFASGDFNGDGKLDVVTQDDDRVYLFLGNGDGSLRAPIKIAASNPVSVAAGDFNEDGLLDLMVLVDFGRAYQLLLGRGDGTFISTPSKLIHSPGEDGILTWAVGDMDGDQHKDVALANANCGGIDCVGTEVSILFGDGKGNFTESDAIATYPGSDLLGFDPADLNKDGRTDLVGFSENTVEILRFSRKALRVHPMYIAAAPTASMIVPPTMWP